MSEHGITQCVCGHAPEEHGSGFLRACEEDGCLCACYEPDEETP